MNDQLAKATEIFRKIDIELFYCVTIWSESIKLQGKYSPSTVRELEKIGFHASSFQVEPNGAYIVASLDGINVTLTD